MRTAFRQYFFSFLLFALLIVCPTLGWAQSGSGMIEGVVQDPTGAVVPNAKVAISYPVSGFRQETSSGAAGGFRFANVPFNPYHLVVTAQGFDAYTQDVD